MARDLNWHAHVLARMNRWFRGYFARRQRALELEASNDV